MREKKFTDGPWESFNRDYYPEITDGSAFEGMGHVGQVDDGMSVCQMCDDFPDVVKANAALISAAPELLEALEQLACCVSDSTDNDTINALHKAGRAVRKAYGETP